MLSLTYGGTSLDPITGVVVGARDRRQLAVRRGDVAELVPQIRPTLVDSVTSHHGLVVNNVV